MHFQLKFPKLMVSGKMLLINLMICAAFLLIVGIILLSNNRVQNNLFDIVDRDMGRVIANSRESREFSNLFADIDLLKHTFCGKNTYLTSAGKRLADAIKRILESQTDPDIKQSFLALYDHFEAFIAQCVVVNTVLNTRESIDRKTRVEITELENLIAEMLVRLTLNEEDTSFAEQLLTLVMGYQESLLLIGKLYAEMGHEHYLKPLNGKTSPVTVAIDDLILRLQTITASTPEVAQFGIKIVNHVQNYRDVVLKFYASMEELGSRMRNLDISRTASMSAMEKLDQKVSWDIKSVKKEIMEVIHLTGSAILMLSFLVIVFLYFATTYLIRSTIKRPMKAILEGIESFRQNGVGAKIEIGRTDEWDIIEKSFNKMSADLSQSYLDLQESQTNLQLLFDSLQDFLFILDTKGHILQVNPVVLSRLGYTKYELLGKNVQTVLPPDRQEEAGAIIADMVTGKKEISTVPLITKDGDLIPVDTKVTSGKWGNQDALFGISRDTSERQKTEKEKARLESQLQQAQKMEAIGTLAGGIAHDFNNILGAIMGYAELVQRESEKASVSYLYLQEVVHACRRAKDLVKQILTFSRQTEKEQAPVRVETIVKEVVKLLRASLPATIEVFQDIQSDGLVMGDPIQIHQIILNLCTNAGHAMQDQGGRLTISLIKLELDSESSANFPNLKPGPYLQVTVSDTGHGIPASEQNRIFEPFFTTKEKGEGTGMGLAVVHGIVTDHGGDIFVHSEPGQGATFTVFLPAVERRIEPRSQDEMPIPTGSERILFIDDEAALADAGKHFLEALGYEIVTKTSSVEAFELFKSQPDRFDLVITDMTMPTLTGDKLAEQMMSIRSDLPMIMCTGFSARMSKTKALNLGIRAYLTKPVLGRQMAETIRMVLDDSPG
jgi:PAS domain S-box-containing protein